MKSLLEPCLPLWPHLQKEPALPLWHHFTVCTVEFLAPLNWYLNTLIPAPASSIFPTQKMKRFNVNNFFATLNSHGLPLSFKLNSKQIERWLRGPGSGVWLANGASLLRLLWGRDGEWNVTIPCISPRVVHLCPGQLAGTLSKLLCHWCPTKYLVWVVPPAVFTNMQLFHYSTCYVCPWGSFSLPWICIVWCNTLLKAGLQPMEYKCHSKQEVRIDG